MLDGEAFPSLNKVIKGYKMKYKTYGLDNEQINFITETIQDIYTLELIFQDMKMNELNINYSDTKFIIPNLNLLNSKLNLLPIYNHITRNNIQFSI